MPIERKCLTDGLVSVPVVDVVADGALVLPPALVSTIGCAVTSDTAIVSPAVLARAVTRSPSFVVFIDALVRVGAVIPAGNVTVYLTTTLAAKRRAMTDKRRPAAPTLSEVTATIERVTLSVASAMAWAMMSLAVLSFMKSAASLSDPTVKVNPLEKIVGLPFTVVVGAFVFGAFVVGGFVGVSFFFRRRGRRSRGCRRRRCRRIGVCDHVGCAGVRRLCLELSKSDRHHNHDNARHDIDCKETT